MYTHIIPMIWSARRQDNEQRTSLPNIDVIHRIKIWFQRIRIRECFCCSFVFLSFLVWSINSCGQVYMLLLWLWLRLPPMMSLSTVRNIQISSLIFFSLLMPFVELMRLDFFLSLGWNDCRIRMNWKLCVCSKFEYWFSR